MSPQVVRFLAALSHVYGTYLFAAVLLLWFLLRRIRRAKFRSEAEGDEVRRRRFFALQAVFTLVQGGALVLSVACIGCYGCAVLKAREGGCKQNLRQIAQALLLYSEQYDDRLPAGERWAGLITLVRDPETGKDPLKCEMSESAGSYALNRAVAAASVSGIDAPAATVLLFDANAPVISFLGGPADVDWNRHNLRANFAFTDGHSTGVNSWKVSRAKDDLVWSPTSSEP